MFLCELFIILFDKAQKTSQDKIKNHEKID